MDDLVRATERGWTFTAGVAGDRFFTRIESPDGAVVTKGPFASDNEALQAMAEARARIRKGEKP